MALVGDNDPERLIEKSTIVVDRGDKLLARIPQYFTNKQGEVFSEEYLEGAVSNRVHVRRYGTVQAAELAGVSHTAIYAAEKAGRLPEPERRHDTKKLIRAYTIDDINHIREVLGTPPKKPDGCDAAIVGVLNLKGGSRKTTTCHLFSQYLAMRGWRVLLVDTDPQGSLGHYYGKEPDISVSYEDTIAPYMLGDDEALVEAGWPEGSSASLAYAIKKTYWSNIDIIPACSDNLEIDLMLPSFLNSGQLSQQDALMMLRDGLKGVSHNYDFIIIDGTPSVNISTMNVVSACDVIFVPTPADRLDFASTVRFTSLIQQMIKHYPSSNTPDMRYFITKFTKSDPSLRWAKAIRETFGVERGDVLRNEAHTRTEVAKANQTGYSVYEQNPSDSNRTGLKQACQMFDDLFEEMLDAIKETCFY